MCVGYGNFHLFGLLTLDFGASIVPRGPERGDRRARARAMDHQWSEVLPPKDLTDFLRSIKLEHLDTTLARLGFDDVEDFKSWDTDACAHFRSALEKDMVPVGHIGKVIRAISGLRPSCQASSSSPDVVTPVAPAASDAVPPAAVVHAAALSVGTATAAMHKDAHAAKVLSFINDQKKMNPDAPRLLYGRGHSAKIKPYEEVMNKAALELLYANPSLISWDGSRVKTQPLIDAAKIDANAACAYLVLHLPPLPLSPSTAASFH